MLLTDIHVRSFTGSGLKPYLHGVAKLRMEVFREYPYFEEPDGTVEMHHLNRLVSCKESIGVLIFDHMTLVGASLGSPLALEEEALLQPFHDKHFDPQDYFFFGDSVLLRAYRGRGIAHHFFDAREAHIQQLERYKYACFYFPDDVTGAAASEDFTPLFDFWRKRGYIHHPELQAHLPWKKIDHSTVVRRQVSFWVKTID